jgi:hypothetical protein
MLPQQFFLKFFPFLTDKPLEFEYDPDTGVLTLFLRMDMQFLNRALEEKRVGIMLTTAASQALLADLPKLEALLKEAAKGPTKPSSVQ